MAGPVQQLLDQLGGAIAEQIAIANDRAALAETNFAKLCAGLRALTNDLPNPAVPVANDTSLRDKDDPVTASSSSIDCPPDHTPTMYENVLLNLLTRNWQTAHSLRKAACSGGQAMAYGTIYNRMAKLVASFPAEIEAREKPMRWKLREPSYVDGQSDAVVAEMPKRGVTAKSAKPRSGGMPPAAITDARERIQGFPAPIKTFQPSLRHGDSFEIMASIDDASIDLILTDPPYGVSGLNIDPAIDLSALWAVYRRIIKPKGAIVMFGAQPFSSRLIVAAEDLFKHDLIWIKNRATQTLQARNRPLRQHEDILVFTPGTTIQRSRSARRYTYNPLGQTSSGLMTIGSGKHSTYLKGVTHNPGLRYQGTTNNPRSTIFCPKDEEHAHPFQKPVALLEYLIRSYSNEGDLVLDNFMGSGSTCVAAMRSGRRSIGIEKSKEYFDVAQARIGHSVIPFSDAA